MPTGPCKFVVKPSLLKNSTRMASPRQNTLPLPRNYPSGREQIVQPLDTTPRTDQTLVISLFRGMQPHLQVRVGSLPARIYVSMGSLMLRQLEVFEGPDKGRRTLL